MVFKNLLSKLELLLIRLVVVSPQLITKWGNHAFLERLP